MGPLGFGSLRLIQVHPSLAVSSGDAPTALTSPAYRASCGEVSVFECRGHKEGLRKSRGLAHDS